MMKEQFVTYEMALKLKELNFNEECFGYYSNKNKDTFFSIPEFNQEIISFLTSKDLKIDNLVKAPIHQSVQKWLREIHYIHIYPECVDSNLQYNYICNILHLGILHKTDEYTTYEEALEEGLKQGLNLIKV